MELGQNWMFINRLYEMCLFSCGIVMIQAGIWETQPETSEKKYAK